MARYEFSDGDSHKFWEIIVEGPNHKVTYGRVGVLGQSKVNKFESDKEADTDAALRIAEKTKKGYGLVTTWPEENKTVSSIVPPNPELEALVEKSPPGDALAVYGDYLQSQGDSMGELIARYNAGGDVGEEDARKLLPMTVQRALNFRFTRMGYQWRGEIPLTLEWYGLFISQAWIGTHYDYRGPQPPELLEQIWNRACGKFIGALTLGLPGRDGDYSYHKMLTVLEKSGVRPGLGMLHVGDFISDECEISWSNTGDLGPLLPLFPNLSTLKVHGGSIFISDANHDKLQELSIETGGLPRECAASLAVANFPAMERMEISFGREAYGGDGDIEALKPLFQNKTLPKLKSLGLINSEFQDDIAEQLKDSSLAAGLERLDLSQGTMTDRGGQAMLEAAENLKHVGYVDISDNYVSDEMCALLREAYDGRISVSGQDDPDEDGNYYTSVGE